MKNTNNHTFGEKTVAIVLAGMVLFVTGTKKLNGPMKLTREVPQTKNVQTVTPEIRQWIQSNPTIVKAGIDNKKELIPMAETIAILPATQELLQVVPKKGKKKNKQKQKVRQYYL